LVLIISENATLQIPLESLLHSAQPALARLLTLELYQMGLQSFPDALAHDLRCLTTLDLNCCNFYHLPAALKKITTLRTINLDFNNNLQLNASDFKVLAALTHLENLVLPKRFRKKKDGQGNLFPHLNVIPI
jgi:hypothetical protein